MVCIYCLSKTSVSNSRSSKQPPRVWRRRQCKNCQAVFTTKETPDLELSLRLRHSDGTLEPFYQEKMLISLYKSLSHRRTALNDSMALVDTIVSKLLANGVKHGIIEAKDLLDTSYLTLKMFDKASATYYLAHYPK